MKTNRIEAFSDGVMAILITIMVLELKAPHDPTPASLARMWPTFFAYVLSFVIIAIYWVNHHYLIHLVSHVDAVHLHATRPCHDRATGRDVFPARARHRKIRALDRVAKPQLK